VEADPAKAFYSKPMPKENKTFSLLLLAFVWFIWKSF
jgi:hypothetical protein